MLLNVLGDWKFSPNFMTDKEMTLTLHPLSGEEELSAGVGEDKDHVAYIKRLVVKIDNPIQLKMPDGKTRDLEPADIPAFGALKALYYDIIVEYAEHTKISDDKLKN